jgi:glutamine amidotransferase
MCLALYKPAKAKLNQDEMRTAFKANPDGAGFAYYDPALKRVVIQRGYFSFDELWADLVPIMDDNCPLILHFRWATHGDVNVENCHPFMLSDGALIHNGIITGMGTSTYKSKYYTPPVGQCETECSDDRSDTREFVEDYLCDMGMPDLRAAKKLIEHTIGYSKLVTIHNDGSVIIFNEDMGHWRNGVWYSNDSYKKAKAHLANPANLTPTGKSKYDGKYDYYGTSTKPLSEQYDESLVGESEQMYVSLDEELECERCHADEDWLQYVYDPNDDSFLVECLRCGEVWVVDGDSLSTTDFNAMYYSAMSTLKSN